MLGQSIYVFKFHPYVRWSVKTPQWHSDTINHTRRSTRGKRGHTGSFNSCNYFHEDWVTLRFTIPIWVSTIAQRSHSLCAGKRFRARDAHQMIDEDVMANTAAAAAVAIACMEVIWCTHARSDPNEMEKMPVMCGWGELSFFTLRAFVDAHTSHTHTQASSDRCDPSGSGRATTNVYYYKLFYAYNIYYTHSPVSGASHYVCALFSVLSTRTHRTSSAPTLILMRDHAGWCSSRVQHHRCMCTKTPWVVPSAITFQKPSLYRQWSTKLVHPRCISRGIQEETIKFDLGGI